MASAKRRLADRTGAAAIVSDPSTRPPPGRGALPTIAALHERGYRLAVMANQPVAVEGFRATLPVDRVATSAAWGVIHSTWAEAAQAHVCIDALTGLPAALDGMAPRVRTPGRT